MTTEEPVTFVQINRCHGCAKLLLREPVTLPAIADLNVVCDDCLKAIRDGKFPEFMRWLRRFP